MTTHHDPLGMFARCKQANLTSVRRATRGHGITAIVVLAMTGCAHTTAGDAHSITKKTSTTEASSTTASTTVSNTLPGPHPPPNENNDGTSFDPCLTYSAEEIQSWGVSPADVVDLAPQLPRARGCRWEGDGWSVSQQVGNGDLSTFLDPDVFPGTKPIRIGDRDGALFPIAPESRLACGVALQSQRAVVTTGVSVIDLSAQKKIPDACQKAIEITTTIASKIPK